MKKFGLIGHPIAHSLSPALFKAAYGGKYAYDLIEGEDFEKSYDRFIEEYYAINVTAPFKELAYAKADKASDECKAVGAANILIKNSDGHSISADNSDIAGVSEALRSAGIADSKGMKALIVGCGGAAMASTYATWAELGCETVVINRNLDKAERFVSRLKETGKGQGEISAGGLDCFEEHFRKSDIIIYTLPLAIPALHTLSRTSIRGGGFWQKRRSKVILEANYKDPALTQETRQRISRINPEIRFISGKEWLLHQAVGAYRSFTGEDPNIEEMRKVL